MKKLLALELALVMTLGLATVGANAAYSDDTDITHDEAVAVMSAIGVLAGTDGKFNPSQILTREQGAKIITYMLMGGQAAGDALTTSAAPFDDVAADRWSTGSIAYCKAQGIIGGVGDNKFDPTGTLTGYQFAKMLLVALGYDAEIEKLVGSDWSINTAKLVTDINLADDIDSFVGSTGITRDNAAQLAFNALTSTMVYYPATIDSGDNSTRTNLQSSNIVNSATTYEYRNGGARGINGNGTDRGDPNNTMQLCEKYFPKLSIETSDADDLGHVAQTWTFKGEKFETAVTEAHHKFVSGNTKSIEDAIGDYNKKLDLSGINGTRDIYLNGEQGNGLADATTDTLLQGDVVELYVNSNDVTDVERICITRYSTAKISAAVATRTSGTVDQVRVPGVVSSWTNVDDVEGYEGLAKDDIVYYYKTDSGSYHIFKAETFEGSVTVFTAKSGTTPAKYTIGGTNHMVNGNVGYTHFDSIAATSVAEYNTTYKFWKDDNGYLLWDEKVEDGSREYALIYDLKYVASGTSSNLGTNGVAQARLVFMDGSTKIVNIDTIDGYTPVNAATTITSIIAATGDAVTAGTTYYESGTAPIATGTTINDAAAVGASYLTAGYYFALEGTGAATVGANTVKWLAVSPLSEHNNGIDTGFDTWLNVEMGGARTYVALTGASGTAGTAQDATKATLYTYTVNSDGSYVLENANDLNNVNAGQIALNNTTVQAKTSKIGNANDTVAVNDSTVFVVVKDPAKSSPTFTVYTGKNNCPALSDNTRFAYASEKGVATNVVVTSHGGAAVTGSSIYLLANSYKSTTKIKGTDGATTTYYIWDAYVNGEVKEIMLTGTAETRALAGGIGLYTDPTTDDNGGYDSLDTLSAGTTAASRNITKAYGWKMSGTTLMTGKDFDGSSYTYTFDCPTDAVYLVKDGSNFTVGTAADMDADDNDQVYVALDANHSTTTTNGNTVQTVYVIKQDSNETGFTVSTTGTSTFSSTSATNIDGDATQKYTVYTNNTKENSVTVTLTFKAACRVAYENAGSTTVPTGTINDGTVDVEVATNVITLTISGADASKALKITAEDGTVAYYAISYDYN